MAKVFPNISDTSFPNVGNVNVFGYKNDFDYSKFAQTQMHVKLMSVPWDLGEVHVGLKSVPIGNVVAFESDTERDEWLDAQPGIEFDTRYRAYHDDDTMKIPIPYESAVAFNYVVVDYDQAPVEYGNLGRVSRWLYFVRSVKAESLNTTILDVARDTWTMFAHAVDISYMMLERGHAPMFAAPSPSEYLESPIENNEMLLADDVSFGLPSRSTECSAFVVNDGNMIMCFVTSSYPEGDWGEKDDGSWKVPRQITNQQDGNVAPFVFAIDAEDRAAFMEAIDLTYPQFLQAVQGVFFVPEKLVRKGREFSLFGTECVTIGSQRVEFALPMPTVEDFGFDEEDRSLTKLYTSPYSLIEITDEDGNVTVVNVEDCSGGMSVSACVSMAWPWINVSAHVNGIGSTSTSGITFRNLNAHEFDHGGRWFETLKRWEIPVMSVFQGNGKTNDFATHFDRDTQKNNTYDSADTSKQNSNATSLTVKNNTDDSADTQQDNINANANTLVANTKTQTDANLTITTQSNSSASSDKDLGNALMTALQRWNAGYQYDVLAEDYNASIQSAAIGTTGNVLSSAASGAVTGAVGGSVIPGAGTAAGAAVGALAGAGSAVVGGVVSGMQTAVMLNATKNKVDAAVKTDKASMQETQKNNTDRTNNQNTANTANTKTQNTASNTIAATSASTMKANAKRTRDTTVANAKRSYDTELANAKRTYDTTIGNVDRSIANQIRQSAIMAPNEFGASKGGENSVTRPMGIFVNVSTQSRSAIKQAATQFKRYGYCYNQMWEFSGFNVGKRFTYWKCADLWMTAQSIPDAFADQIRNYLLQGVTVWRRPEYINHTDINDNF